MTKQEEIIVCGRIKCGFWAYGAFWVPLENAYYWFDQIKEEWRVNRFAN